MPVIKQALETLTEFCQGPCQDNQNAIAFHECNGLDIIIALVLNEIEPLGKTRFDLVLEVPSLPLSGVFLPITRHIYSFASL